MMSVIALLIVVRNMMREQDAKHLSR